jgi:hypothetical protein
VNGNHEDLPVPLFPAKVLAFKHLSDFAQMQPVREPIVTGEANRAYHCAIAAGPRRRGDRKKFVSRWFDHCEISELDRKKIGRENARQLFGLP